MDLNNFSGHSPCPGISLCSLGCEANRLLRSRRLSFPAMPPIPGMTRRLPSFGLMLCLGIVLAALGCQPSMPPADNGVVPDVTVNSVPDRGQEVAPTDPEGGDSVGLRFATFAEIQQYIDDLEKPAIVDFWSLACPPCIDEFPGLVNLQRQYGDRIVCISVDVDYDGRKTKPPESYKEEVEAFLTEQEATFTNFLCTTPSDDVFTELGIDSIPSVLVYGADGELVKQFVDAGDTLGFGYQRDVEPFVSQWLGQQ